MAFEIENGVLKKCILENGETEVIIPEGTTEVNRDAFSDCNGIQTITIPDSLEDIVLILRRITTLETVIVSANNPNYATIDGVLYAKDMKTLLCYPANKPDESFVVPDFVKYISEYAFSNTNHLQKLVLHNEIDYYQGTENSGLFGMKIYVPFFCCFSIREIDGLPEFMINKCRMMIQSAYPEYYADIILNGKANDRKEKITGFNAEVRDGGADAIAESVLGLLAAMKYTKKHLTNTTEFFDKYKNGISAKCFYEFYKMLLGKKAYDNIGVIPIADIAAAKEASGDPDAGMIKELLSEKEKPAKTKSQNITQLCKIDNGELVDFAVNSGLTEIVLPDNIVKLYKVFRALNGRPIYSGIKKLFIPKNVEQIAGLDGLIDLETIEVDPKNNKFVSVNGLLFEKDSAGLTLVAVPKGLKELVIPKSCEIIGNIYPGLDSFEKISVEVGCEFFEYTDGYLVQKSKNRNGDVIAELIYIDSTKTDVVVPEGVTNVSFAKCKDRAEKITSIKMPNSVTQISLKYNDSLKEIELSNGIKSLGSNYSSESPFYNCTALEKVVIPEGVEIIGEECFMGCTALREVSLPSTLTDIYSEAFANCSSLKQISIPANVKVADDAFTGSGLEGNDFIEGIKYCGDIPVEFDPFAKSFRFKSGTTKIPKDFFNYSGNQNFHKNQEYETVYISETVTEIDEQQLSPFKEIIVDENNPKFKAVDGVLFDKGMTTLLRFPIHKECDEYLVPDTVKEIAYAAFEWCTQINKVVIPEGVTKIGFEAFALTDNLEEIIVPYTVTDIDRGAFVTEYNAKDHHHDVKIIFKKDDILIPMRLKRNWGLYTEEQNLDQFIRYPNSHISSFAKLKDAVYKRAAAELMYFVFDEKGESEEYVRNNADKIMKDAIDIGSTGIIREMLEHGLVDNSKINGYVKKASSLGNNVICEMLKKG